MLWLQNELAARSARPIKALPEINVQNFKGKAKDHHTSFDAE